jgi:hypothetical protein
MYKFANLDFAGLDCGVHRKSQALMLNNSI